MANYLQARRPRPHATGALERDAAALFAVMTDLLRVYQFRDRDRVGYHGLTITQSYVMEAVIRRGRLTLNELAAEMNLDKSTLSRVVDGLEKKHAVQRTANPADGRSTLIEATRSGKERRKRIETDIIAENAKVLSGFSPGVRRQLVVLVSALTRAARERQLERVAEDAL
jgi:MarR family 2-MHQ and catechol resistance regulon transcriptional repressor